METTQEKKTLLPVQSDVRVGKPDIYAHGSNKKVSIITFKNPDDSNKYDGQNSRQASFVDKETKYSSMKRKPFHYNTLKDPLETSHDQEMAAKHNRYRYISKLSGHTVIIPSHILPPNLFLIFPKEEESKQNSLITIFSIWNTMMGTSLLSIPWAIQQAGFALGLILMILMAGICLYSCYLILKSAEDSTEYSEILEFSDICKKYLGKPGEVIAVLFSLAAIAGTAIVYWVLMSNFLYYSGTYIRESVVHAYSVPSWKNSSTVEGTLSVLYILIFSITKASIWGIHMDFSTLPMFKTSFPALTGILTLAYFIHNCILSIMRNQEQPKNNARDLSIAYCLVALTYISVGFLFYMAFPRDKSCIQQVLLDNLPAQDVMTFIARLFLLFQLTTVFPLIVYITRVQFLLYFFNKVYPSFLHVFVLNLVLVACCVLCAVFYPHVGNIIRYVGSLSGLAYNYSLPCIVYIMIQRRNGQLTIPSAVFHCFIVVLGVLNFFAQFVIDG
ncbi:sodium-coupled neutral amino acid transporter 9 homolog isoform X4 [Montipora capricornis]|uniref:sodium-coupled neutral amino acid transporter 9 homolog isoform X4 n=1 Tax=Montipora capricornis TaxID=246305 RepID=UPI0035F1FD8D